MQTKIAKGLAIIMMILSFSTLNAQTTVWPTADTNTINASQFKNGLAGWTTVGYTNAATVWTWKANGKADQGQGSRTYPAITSPSVANGAMVFDSDFLDRGASGTYGSGASPSPHDGALISPTINAAGYTGLTVQLNAYFRNFSATPYIAWSENGGVTWKDSVAISFYNRASTTVGTDVATFDYQAADYFLTNRPDDVIQVKLKGSVGTPNFKIKIVWSGDYYFMILDDVKLISNNKVDMQVNRNFFAIAPNLVEPKNQVDPVRFLSDVSNQGTKTATGVKLNMTIKNLVGGAIVHNSTFSYPGSIKPDSTAENALSPNTFTPSSAATGTFVGKYTVSSDSSDAYIRNDTAQFFFSLSDSTFQKAFGAVYSNRPADQFWSASAPKGWKVGNGFYVPNGRTSTATAITAFIGNADILRGKTVVASLYRVRPVTLDVNGDMAASSLLQVAAAEYTIPATAAANTSFRIPIYSTLGSGNTRPAILEDTTTYLAVIEYSPSAAADDALEIGLDSRINYSAMTYASRAAGAGKTRLGCVWTTIGGTDDALMHTDFSGLTPVVSLTVVPYRVDTKDILADNNKIELFPNPTANTINLEVELTNSAELMYVKIMDITGKEVQSMEFSNVKNSTLPINISTLTNGTYLMQVTTQDGTRTKKFVVSK
jgi:Secretion system C-terminal sorting domain